MAKILHVSNFGRKPKGAFQHNVGHKISNGLIRNGHNVVNFSDRDVARAGSLIGHRKFGVAAANRELRDFCRSIEPEIILLGHADVIRPATLADIRADLPSVRILQWNVDPVFEPDNIRRISSKLDVVDATLVSTAGQALLPLARPGMRLGFMPNPVDYSIEPGRNDLQTDLPYDLFCSCGNPTDARYICGKDWMPEGLMENIRAAQPGLRVLQLGMSGFPLLAGAAYQRALQSAAIGLNLSRRNDFFLYSSDRLAHMVGNGMAVLVDRATGYGELFDDSMFAFFSTVEEMTAQLQRLTADKPYRQALAGRGRERYHALFNEQIVARYIVDVAMDRLRPADYPWPTLVTA